MLIRRGHFWVALFIGALAMTGQSRADIYQWEYVNPTDPSQGKQQSSMLVPDGAGVNAVPNSFIGGNLSMAYLIGADLTNAFVRESNLTNADLSQSELKGADFGSCDLTNANFAGADLTDADLYYANLTSAYFFGADLTGANLSGAQIKNASFYASSLTPSQLYSTTNYQADDLAGIDLVRMILPVRISPDITFRTRTFGRESQQCQFESCRRSDQLY